jgi:hypothetical protein
MRLYGVTLELVASIVDEPERSWSDGRGRNFEKLVELRNKTKAVRVVIAHDDPDFVKTIIVKRPRAGGSQ